MAKRPIWTRTLNLDVGWAHSQILPNLHIPLYHIYLGGILYTPHKIVVERLGCMGTMQMTSIYTLANYTYLNVGCPKCQVKNTDILELY